MTALPLSLQTNGPPESPWQASLPPTLGYPAQSIVSVILPPYAALHWLLVIAGTLTYWRSLGADPPDDKVPHPLVKHLASVDWADKYDAEEGKHAA